MLSDSNQRRIEQVMAQLGLNKTQVQVYIEVLKSKPSSVQEIARQLKLNRVTVHSSISELISKGLVYETRKGKRRLIAAEPPEVLEDLMQKKQEDLNTVQSQVSFLKPILENLQLNDDSRPSIRFYEGDDGLKKMLEESLLAKGEVLVFSNGEALSKRVGRDYLLNYMVKRAERKIPSRLLLSPSEFTRHVKSKEREFLTKVRFTLPDMKWTGGIFTWNDSLAIMSYTEKNVTCTIIENPEIANFFNTVIFEMSWGQV